MQFHTDHHFVIGRHHITNGQPCQDHALTGVGKGESGQFAYAVVSDGCSSAGQTDIGSRLITTATAKQIKNFFGSEVFGPGVSAACANDIYIFSKASARYAAMMLNLGTQDLLATQLFAAVDNTGNGFVSVYGDGVVAFVSETGNITVSSYEWDSNMPFYPHYNGSTFEDAHGGLDKPALTVNHYSIAVDNSVVEKGDFDKYTVDRGSSGVTVLYSVVDPVLICLLTDGVHQIHNLDFLDALRSLLAFKNLSGDFVKRRMIRFQEDIKKIGKGPLDDLAMAVICVERN